MSEQIKISVKMEDGVSKPAKTAAQALADLRQGLDRSATELGQMKKAMREMKAGGDTTSAGFKRLEEQIKTKTAAIASMRSKYVELGGSFRKAEKPAKALGKELGGLASMAEQVPGPMGSILGRLAGLSKFAVGGLIVGGIVAIGAALVGLAAASVSAGVALVAYGVRQADARRSEALRLEGLTRLRRGMHEAGGSATEMQSAIDRVSDSSSASRSTLEGYAERLHRLGLRGDNFTAALEGMATRGEVLGDRYAQSFAGMAAQAARSGRSVRALANDVQVRLGDIAGRKLIALDVTTRKLHENLASLFRNVKIEGFLKLFREFASTFSQARVTGRALAGIMERLFAPLDAGAENSVGTVRRVLTVAVTRVIQIENAVLQMRNTWLQAWWELNRRGITMEGTMNRLRAGVSLWGDAIALPFTLASKAAGAFVGSIEWVQNAGSSMGERFRKVWQGINFRDIARNMITGLVTGIISGTVQVVAAVTTMANATTNALRETLQIKSPSRVFAKLGREIPAGLAMGVDAGQEAADAAIANMVDVNVNTPAGLGRGGTTSISIGDIIVQTTGQTGASIATDIRRALAEALEGIVIMGGEVPA